MISIDTTVPLLDPNDQRRVGVERYQYEQHRVEQHHKNVGPIAIVSKTFNEDVYRGVWIRGPQSDFLLDVQFENPSLVNEIHWHALRSPGHELRHVCDTRHAPVFIECFRPIGRFKLLYCNLSQDWLVEKGSYPFADVAYEYTSPADLFARYKFWHSRDRLKGLGPNIAVSVVNGAGAQKSAMMFPSPDKLRALGTWIDWVHPNLFGSIYSPHLCMLAASHCTGFKRRLRREHKTTLTRRAALWLG